MYCKKVIELQADSPIYKKLMKMKMNKIKAIFKMI